MFANNSNIRDVIDFKLTKKKNTKKTDVFSNILLVYKKLKEAALYESMTKSKYKVARLNQEELNQLKSLESRLGYSFVAYENDKSQEEDKLMLLNRISSLLDEYLSFCRQVKKQDDSFNEFFEQ